MPGLCGSFWVIQSCCPRIRSAPSNEIAKAKPAEYDLPFSTWSLAKLADFLVAERVAGGISQEGLRSLLREEGVTFQRLKTWKASKDPRFAEKKARIKHLHAVAGREVTPQAEDPEVIFCVGEFGPLGLQPRPGRQWTAVSMTRRYIIWRISHAYDERLRRIVAKANAA
jgi:hypothetical protein